MVANGPYRNWARYARALDLHLSGVRLRGIARELGVTKQRAGQMVNVAKRQLAFRVFKGVKRP